MKRLYSIPTIFHQNIGYSDTPDYVRVCAHNRDSMPDVLTFMQQSLQEMTYGPFKEITFDSTCNHNADRTHYKLLLVPRLKQSQSA